MANSHIITITGMGIICSLGNTPDKFASALKQGESGITAINPERTGIPLNQAALINDFNFSGALASLNLPSDILTRARKAANRAPIVVQTAVYAALSAWQQAQLDWEQPELNTRTGLIIAGQNLSSRYRYDKFTRHQDDLDFLPASAGLHILDTDLVGTISEILQIHGPGFTIGGASASGNVGIIQGQQMVQSGLVDRCVVVGAMADLSPLEVHAWKNIGALFNESNESNESKINSIPAEQSCRPFDQDHAGFVYGQGCGCLILENSASAEQRQAKPLAKLTSSALTLDANKSANPSVEGEIRAMRQALSQANLSPNEIDYLNSHGSSSALGDDTEIQAIEQVFGDHITQLWINATKGLTGHCLYAAGMIEAIATLVQMQHGFVHPNQNLNNPNHDKARFVGNSAQPAAIKHAVSNSFGFGGINSAIVLSRIE